MLLDGLEKSLGFDVSAFSALDGKNAKIVNVCMHLLDEDPSSAVIIFVQYHSELEVLAEALRLRLPAEDKDAVVTYHGVLQQSQKNARLGLLKSGKVQVFLATLASAGTGLNFQDVSYRVLFSTPSYVPAEELQGIGRVVRHGQEMPVKIYRFLMEPCDVRAMAIQFKKMRVMEDTHGGYGDLAHMLLGDAVHDEKMLQDLAAEPSGTAAEPTGEAEDEDEPPSKRSKGKGKAR
jgi:SNF2 family DNA or RNA helicase